MNTPETTPPPAPKAGGSYLFTGVLVLLLVAAGVGYYLYVRAEHAPPPPVDELQSLKPYMAQVGQNLKLAERYKDADGDLVADPPADPAGFLKVDEIGFCVVPTDAPDRRQADEAEWKDFMAALGKAAGKPVKYLSDVATVEDQVGAVKAGRLHVTAFNTGLVPAAVNAAGFVPLYAPADEKNGHTYEMVVLVRADSPARKPEDLKGKTVGLVALSSNSGGKAPIVLFNDKYKMLPGRDYTFVLTGSHEEALAQLVGGKVDAACVASDLFARAAAEGKVRGQDFGRDKVRAVFTSEAFPALCFGVPHDLPPDLRAAVDKAFAAFRFDGTSVGRRYTPQGKVKFAPVSYKADWVFVRHIDEALARLAGAAK